MVKTAFILMIFTTVVASCNKPAALPDKKAGATFQVDTAAYSQVKSADSLSLYLDVEAKWGDMVDTSRADSLADWFLQSGFKIEDMWIPATEPICTRPYYTYGYVYVRLERPDTLIDTLGFVNSPPPNPCFPKWIHFRFKQSSAGE